MVFFVKGVARRLKSWYVHADAILRRLTVFLRLAFLAAAAVFLLVSPSKGESAQKGTLPLIPWPKSVTPGTGTLPLPPSSRVVAEDRRLLPVARILAQEIYLAAGLRFEPVQGTGRAGDIIL